MDLVAGAIEEAGIDERHAIRHGADALREIDGGAPLLVHDADLEREAVETQDVLDAGEQRVRKGDFFRSVHLRLDDIDRPGAAVAQRPHPAQVVDGDGRSDHGVENSFGDLVAVPVEHGGTGHQMADIADEQQAAPRQDEAAAVGRGVFAIRRKAALDALAALVERRRQVALHDAEPVAVDRHLVLGVDGGDRILAIDDRRNRRLEQHVADAGGVAPPHRVAAVDADLDMQPVIDEKRRVRRLRRTAIAGEAARVRQRRLAAAALRHHERAVDDGIARRLAVAAAGERRRFVEEVAREGDDLLTARGVVAPAAGRAVVFGDDVGPVEGVVKASPTRVGGVQGVARVRHRNHQLRPGEGRDFAVHIRRARREGLALGREIADLAQERLVGGQIEGAAGMFAVPVVDPRLQGVAPGEQFAVARGEVVDDAVQPFPEGVGRNAGPRKGLVVDEVVERAVDAQPASPPPFGHPVPLSLNPRRQVTRPAAASQMLLAARFPHRARGRSIGGGPPAGGGPSAGPRSSSRR